MHFLRVSDLTEVQIGQVLDRADELQLLWAKGDMPQSLLGERIGLWFLGNGFRNRVAFEIGLQAMGAQVAQIPGELGVEEPLEDIGGYLANWFSALVVRTRSLAKLETLAQSAGIATVNARTTTNHPCEILGDLQYIRQRRGALDDLQVVFVGPPSNLCMSWIEAARQLPLQVTQVAPAEYQLSNQQLREFNQDARGRIDVVNCLSDAISHQTEVLYTDCWPEEERDRIRPMFAPYQVTASVVEAISESGFFLPCPPVTRGEEVSKEAMQSARCRNTEAKACLLHSQNAVVEFLLSKRKP